jgi:rhamnogalacturonyl hydrolase YesR
MSRTEQSAGKRGSSAPQTLHLLEETLRYSRTRDYTGWDYYDGMSSRLLQALPVDNRWINLVVQESIKRAPVNVRDLFRVEQRRNYKGTALFALANLNADELTTRYEATPSVDYRTEATSLADWLVENRCSGHSGYCGSHQHTMQELDGTREPTTGDVVSTSYGVKALLAADDESGDYADVARTAERFVVDDLGYTEIGTGAKIHYASTDDNDYYTINAVALGARLFVDLYDHFGNDEYRERATRLLDYVVSQQADVGGWMYRDPPDTSHLSMDNHHNGFIIECLQRYADVVDESRYADALDAGLRFYRQVLFNKDGSPNWDESSAYPKDVHAVAQGLIVFSAAGQTDFAARILDWALGELYTGGGQFYYQRRRFYTKRFTLMRWCQAWMAYAISQYLLHQDR